jgi:RNA polymerase sigma-70 factor (ECF subfamily)
MNDHADIDGLVERAVRRDAEAFRALYEHFAPRLYRFALFRVRSPSDAEDLVQRVFMKMIEALPRYEQRGLPFGAWVFRLARNAVIDFERTRKPYEDLEVAEGLGAGPGPEELAELALEREHLVEAFRFLTAEQREVVTLRFFGGLSPAEIGSLLGKREGSIRALQFRALETLRRQLTPDDVMNATPANTRASADAVKGTTKLGTMFTVADAGDAAGIDDAEPQVRTIAPALAPIGLAGAVVGAFDPNARLEG